MRYFLVCILTLSLLSCRSSDQPEKPNNLIPKDKMASILYDVFVLNAAKGSSKIVLENNGIYPENYVFAKYDIDSLQFAESNTYYGFYVEEYEAIIADVEQRINVNRELYKKLVEEEDKRKKRTRDSINKTKDSLKIKTPQTEKPPKERVDYKDYPDSSI